MQGHCGLAPDPHRGQLGDRVGLVLGLLIGIDGLLEATLAT